MHLEQQTDRYVLRDAGFTFCLQWTGDRWQHALTADNGGAGLNLLTSEEGGPDDTVLPSPAYQEVLCERPQPGMCEFQLFGRSGKGIYSAAIRYDSDTHTFNFDLCARGRDPSAPLCTATTYRLGDARPKLETSDSGGKTVLTGPGAGSLVIEPVSVPDSPACSSLFSGADVPQRLTVGCRPQPPSAPAKRPLSVRWQQRWTVSGHP